MEGGAFAVVPRQDCPHVADMIRPLPPGGVTVSGACLGCGDTSENWICLGCFGLHCARGIRACAEAHAVAEHHAIALSASDLSVWCYACDDYITHRLLNDCKLDAYRKKFGEDPPHTVV